MTCEGAYFRITFQIRNQCSKVFASVDRRFDWSACHIFHIIKQYLCIIMSLYHVPGLWRLPDVMFARPNILWKWKHIHLQTNCRTYWWILKRMSFVALCIQNYMEKSLSIRLRHNYTVHHLIQDTKSSQCKRFTEGRFTLLLNLNKYFFLLPYSTKQPFVI